MSKTEYAWIIQRDDGSRYFDCQDRYFSDFYGIDEWTQFYDKNISLYKSKDVAMQIIKSQNLQNCRPVKVQIEIVKNQIN